MIINSISAGRALASRVASGGGSARGLTGGSQMARAASQARGGFPAARAQGQSLANSTSSATPSAVKAMQQQAKSARDMVKANPAPESPSIASTSLGASLLFNFSTGGGEA